MIVKILFSVFMMSANLIVSGYTQPIIQSWRLKASMEALTPSNKDFPKWDIISMEFYENSTCEPGSKIMPSSLGTVIAPTSSKFDDRHEASMAFDNDNTTFYRGNHDSSDAFWIGLQFYANTTYSNNIRCIRLFQPQENFAREAHIQEHNGVDWINRQDVMLGSGLSQISMRGGITEPELAQTGSWVDNDLKTIWGRKDPPFNEFYYVARSIPNQSGRLLTEANVALTGTATQISTSSGGVASRAIDGNTDGNYHRGSVSHTSDTNDPWWNLVLNDVYTIQSIIVYNRIDCCSDRIRNFILIIYNGGTETYNSTGIIDTNVESSSYTFTLSPAVYGDQVRIILPSSGIISLAEVEIYAILPSSIPSLSLVPSKEPSGEPSTMPSVRSLWIRDFRTRINSNSILIQTDFCRSNFFSRSAFKAP